MSECCEQDDAASCGSLAAAGRTGPTRLCGGSAAAADTSHRLLQVPTVTVYTFVNCLPD